MVITLNGSKFVQVKLPQMLSLFSKAKTDSP
jgi:hypothetical protein